ncbi:MAG: hypothetical protein BAJALOKI2v1_560003 [Promethearchaeota archaeon]|nr:MAG: hypothetical protein BAJALOKI2v1_560003 [Candidatus Lokiarchaeota archaeon]
MSLDFYNPPSALLASGSKKGVDLGGQKCIISIDENHNLYNEGYIYTEMSWGEFYEDVAGIEDQIDTFTTKEYSSIREDPDALVKEITSTLKRIMDENRLYYGIGDFEVDAFLNQNTIIPGLKLDTELINKLLEAHKESRDKDLFPTLIKDEEGERYINISFRGTNKDRLHFSGDNLEDISDNLRMAKGFATGIVCATKEAALFFMMNDKIVFREDATAEFYIDQKSIETIESGIKNNELFPVNWFRFDIGIRSFETLELWDDIKDNAELKQILKEYDDYIINFVINKYQKYATSTKMSAEFEKDFDEMSWWEKRKALKDMRDAIKILTKEYKE